LALVEAIRKANSNFEMQKVLELKKQIDQSELSQKRYDEILKNYKSDIDFQRSLQPYFQTAFKNRN